MNILILAAGGNEAFKNAGYVYPKNLIEIDSIPLLQRVTENLTQHLSSLSSTHKPNFIFLVRKEESRHYYTTSIIRLLCASARVIEATHPTAGAACTALLAIDQINNDEPLIITNGDILLNAPLGTIVQQFLAAKLDGGALVFDSIHPRWSYVKCDEQGYVIETSEKRPISNLATVGFYFFARGKDFVTAAMSMISKDAHVGGQFYVCPCYNEMILQGAKIGISKISRQAYISLATPHDVQEYDASLKNSLAGKPYATI